MQKHNFNDINEAALWDDLKRRANERLTNIADIEDIKLRLDVFEKPNYNKIQIMLRSLGKEFFRIFLFKAVKEERRKRDAMVKQLLLIPELKEKIKSKDGLNDELKKRGIDIEATVKNFRFYFWPGYTSLKGQRIFISGENRDNYSDDKYFCGIGNKKVKDYNWQVLVNYFADPQNKQFIEEDQKTQFWIYDIPSTLAFDRIMNQHYLDKEFKYDPLQFIAGSMHHWRSAQTEIGQNDKTKLMDLPLRKDRSELRLITISTSETENEPNVQSGQNEIRITINPKDLPYAGEIIAEKLAPDEIPLNVNAQKLTKWPAYKHEIKTGIGENDLFELQKAAYSYWISETLDSRVNRQINYKHIRDLFDKNHLNALSKRIMPFGKDERLKDKSELFDEVYYSYWYTIFLEGHSQSSDLGSAMFLCNYEYLPGFLLKCSHWIRWVYNELRLIEATTQAEYNAEIRTFRILKHTQRQYAMAILAGAELLKKEADSESLSMIHFAAEVINGHLEVIEQIDNLQEYIKGQRLGNNQFAAIDLTRIINSNITVFDTILSKRDIMHKCIKNILDVETYLQEVKPLLEQIKIKKAYTVQLPESLFSIVIKECMINMLENVHVRRPVLDIQITQDISATSIILTNSVSDHHIKHHGEFYRKLKTNQSVGKRLGWWVIIKLLKAAGCEVDISDEHDMITTKLLKLTITIPCHERTETSHL